ncbi:MAG: CotH kinase family protein [Clostridia bacterium]|nr:CotH kinase family protein [Clostridia bacterium]
MNKKLTSLLLLVAIIVLAVILILIFGGREAQNYSERGSTNSDSALHISEVMYSNQFAVMDDEGGYPDWVELHNNGKNTVNLKGYALSDDEKQTNKYPLPSYEMQPDEYLLVYLDGKAQSNEKSFHATFKVSEGETLFLFNSSGTVVGSVACSGAASNQSIASIAGSYTITDDYSPGFPNGPAGHQSYLDSRTPVASDLVISEIMPANASTIAASDALYYDWIEIYNKGNAPINLKDYYLSDHEDNPLRWQFGNVSIDPHSYLLVYCSKLDRRELPELHTNFKLAASGETVLLSDASGRVLCRVTYPEMADDRSYGLKDGSDTEYVIFTEGTPGKANTEESAQSMRLDQIRSAQSAGLLITEVSTSTSYKVEALNNTSPDYLEIRNVSAAPINLKDYALTDKPTRRGKWVFPDYTLQPGASLTVYLNGANSAHDGIFQTNFNLSKGDVNTVMLSDPDRRIVDRVVVPVLPHDIAYGRDDAMTGNYYFASATPGQSNGTYYLGICETPVFDTPGGMYNGSLRVGIQARDGETIHYTLNASEPKASSETYTGPLDITGTTAVRAVAMREGYLTSDIATSTYFMGISHGVRIVSLVTESDNLFSEEKGIYAKGPGWTETFPHKGANFWQNWERPVHVEIFDNGKLLLSQDAGIKLNGQYSRAEDQKTFAVYARNEYGDNRFRAKLFPDLELDEYKAFVLRNTGQDCNRARMRDSLLTSLTDGTGVLHQESVLCVVYINGQYWGQYNMRERVNKYMIASHEGLTDPELIDKIDIIEANSRTLNGSNKEYRALIDWLKENSLNTDEKLKYVTDRVDVENYFDYQIMEMYVGNSDNGNIKFYKLPTEGSKWKWILFDLDWACNTGSLPNQTRAIDWNVFRGYLNPEGTGVGKAFENILFRRLIENQTMRQLFFDRLAYHVQNTFNVQKVNARIDEYVAAMEPEMPAHYAKWTSNGSVDKWKKHVERFRTYMTNRPEWMKKHFMEYFEKNENDPDVKRIFG